MEPPLNELGWPASVAGPIRPGNPELSLRPVTEADAPFLFRVYAAARSTEMATIIQWTDEQKQAFLRQQFHAQHVHYFQYYQNATYEVILVRGEPAGRLYLHEDPEDLRIMDIALIPEFCNRGMGGGLLRDIQRYAAGQGKMVSIHVERYNPALRLYKRLEFNVKGENGVYYLLEWSPGQGAGAGNIPENEIMESL